MDDNNITQKWKGVNFFGALAQILLHQFADGFARGFRQKVGKEALSAN